jgi:hypothetical protein
MAAKSFFQTYQVIRGQYTLSQLNTEISNMVITPSNGTVMGYEIPLSGSIYIPSPDSDSPSTKLILSSMLWYINRWRIYAMNIDNGSRITLDLTGGTSASVNLVII